MKLTRKELADLMSKILRDNVTVTMVRKNERRWGLKPSKLNARVLRYDAAEAIRGLIRSGVVSPGAGAPYLRSALTALTYPALLASV